MQKHMKNPDEFGRFGPYGGMFAPETLMYPLHELTREYERARRDPAFQKELDYYLREYIGRPTPLWFAERMTRELKTARIYLKREDLCHTGAHKINNSMGQILLAKRMGKKRIIAETGAGQHGVATATVAALFGMECVIYMGKVDMERQALNVFRMRSLGAEVAAVTAGQQTLKEAISEAMRDWVTNVRNTHYILGTVLGAHPYPMMVRDFQSVIGREARRQILQKEKRLPSALVACVGGGSNAMGLFNAFLKDKKVRLIGVEAGGLGIKPGQHAAPEDAECPDADWVRSDRKGCLRVFSNCAQRQPSAGLHKEEVHRDSAQQRRVGEDRLTEQNQPDTGQLRMIG